VARPPAAETRETHASDAWGTPPAHTSIRTAFFNTLARYRPADNWPHALDRERTLTGEKLAERLDEQGYEREREAYRGYLAHKEGGSEG
jgi:hypothetical protein